MAFTTACAPEACSSTAELISCVISFSRVVALRDLRRAVRLLVGGRADLLRELVDLGDHVRDLAQRAVQVAAQFQAFVDDGGALVHVVDGLAGFLLDALDQFGNFLGGLRRFLGQLADFVRHHRKAQAVFAGARRFDGGVQRQQVGLLGQVVDDLDDLADVVRALSERVDDCRPTTGWCR